MKQLKNKILIKVNRKLIFIISILMIVALNLFGEIKEEIKFEYYYYTNKLYHSTLKTEIVPSEYIFITTYSNKDYNYRHENLYLYNLKTREKKLFYVNKGNYIEENAEYYDINGNMTTNWIDTNMYVDGLYEITNNRFGEIFYNQKIRYGHTLEGYDSVDDGGYGIVKITKDNEYIQKAYKYSLTQPEIINKKDRGIYLFRRQYDSSYSEIFYTLCFQNEYYKNNIYDNFGESELLNYNSNGRVIVHIYDNMIMYRSYSSYDGWRKQWITNTGGGNYALTNIVYFQLNNKSLIKPTWNEFTNDFLNYRKSIQKEDKVFYTKEDIEENLRKYNVIMDTKYLGFIPIEEFEYYLLAD